MMLADLNRAVVDGQANETLLNDLWQHIQRHLEDKKERIIQEISHYPPPIPACDTQFNGLLEDRATILQELGEVNSILKKRLTALEQIKWLNEFMQQSQHLNEALVESIRQRDESF